MDVLTDVLQTARLQSAYSVRWELSSPWGMEVAPPRAGLGVFLAVTEGRGLLIVKGTGEQVALATGDIVVFRTASLTPFTTGRSSRPWRSPSLLPRIRHHSTHSSATAAEALLLA